MSSEGASNNEIIISACRNDQLDLLKEVTSNPGEFDINATDSVGNTALHWACYSGANECVEYLLQHDNIHTNLKDKVLQETPLHKVFNPLKHPQLSELLVELLLEGGSDYKLKNKEGKTTLDLIPKDEEFEAVRNLLLQAEASSLLDLPVDDDDDDDGTASDYSE